MLGAQQQLQLYVFEEHLEYCPVKERNIEIDTLDDNWVKDDPAGLEYTVPHELKVKIIVLSFYCLSCCAVDLNSCLFISNGSSSSMLRVSKMKTLLLNTLKI